MNENRPAHQYQDDEIDLKDLLKKIIKVLERGKKTVLLSVLLGIILGVGYFFSIGISFQSRLVLSSDILKLANIEALFAPLETLLEEGNVGLVAQKLQVETEVAKKISNLEVKSVFENETLNKESISYFEITATIADNTILPQLQQGIIAYLVNNDYVKRRVALDKSKYEVLIEQAENELTQVDQLKKRIASGSDVNPSSANVVLMEPADLYEQSLLMMEKKQEFIEELALVESIEVVNGFTPFSKRSTPSWIFCVAVGLAGGLIFSFAILFLREMGRYVRS